MFRNAPLSSAGKRRVLEDEVAAQPDDLVDVLDEDRDRPRRRRRRSTQSQTASNGIAPSTIGLASRSACTVSSRPYVSRTSGEFGMSGRPCSASTDISRMPMMKCFGLSGLPVFHAGHASWQRPHSVQVKPSSRSFQPRSASVRTPNVASSASRSIARQLTARLELAEVDVEEARGDVEVLAGRQVDEERRDEDHVRPPQGAEGCRQQPGVEAAQR